MKNYIISLCVWKGSLVSGRLPYPLGVILAIAAVEQGSPVISKNPGICVGADAGLNRNETMKRFVVLEQQKRVISDSSFSRLTAKPKISTIAIKI